MLPSAPKPVMAQVKGKANPMSTTRTFLIASSLARLAGTERGSVQIVEGYFPAAEHGSLFVRLSDENSTLVLVSPRPDGGGEHPAEISRAQGEALLALTSGRIQYHRITVTIDRRPVYLDRITLPGALDRVTVGFAHDREAETFQPPAWFGPDVTGQEGYRNGVIAIQGLADVPEIAVSNAALGSLLDALETPSVQDMDHAHRPPAAKPAASRPAPLTREGDVAAAFDAEADALDSAIEDDVIRELARSLRPR